MENDRELLNKLLTSAALFAQMGMRYDASGVVGRIVFDKGSNITRPDDWTSEDWDAIEAFFGKDSVEFNVLEELFKKEREDDRTVSIETRGK